METLYHIYAGLGGGFGGAGFSRAEWCKDEEEATQLAYEDAVSEYESYEGSNGIMDRAEIADDNGLDPEEDADEVEEIYQEEMESWLDYWAIPAIEDGELPGYMHTDESIEEFDGEYAFLSNFFETPVTICGRTWKTAEAAFQAAKTLVKSERDAIFNAPTPGKAKRLGRTCTIRPDWEDIKVHVMADIVRAKFTQNPELRQKLLDTGHTMLIEGNYWHDNFWGICGSDCIKNEPGVIHNALGVILYSIREEFRLEDAGQHPGKLID